jgi:hypothetical protein
MYLGAQAPFVRPYQIVNDSITNFADPPVIKLACCAVVSFVRMAGTLRNVRFPGNFSMGKSPICLRSPHLSVGRHQSNHQIVKSTQALHTHKAEQARIVPVPVGVRDYKRTSHPIFFPLFL